MRRPARAARLVGVVALGLVLLGATLVLFERQLIYFPLRAFDVTPSELGLPYEDLLLTTEDRLVVHGWWLPVEGSRLTVVVCHGNAGNISHRLDRALLMQSKLKTDVLLFDYRGYGRSGGAPDEEGTYRDGRAAYRYLLETRRLPAERVVLFGESLGAAVALQLALERPPRALVLESPFTSVAEMARVVLPLLPPGPWIRTRYDNIGKIAGLRAPLLVLHGERDTIVPFAQGRRVFEAAPGPKRFFAIPGASHNDTYVTGGEPYWQAWKEFLESL